MVIHTTVVKKYTIPGVINCCHGNHCGRLYLSPKVLVQHCNKVKSKYSLPEESCHWLRTCNVAMAMAMVGYTCVQSTVVMHPTIV